MSSYRPDRTPDEVDREMGGTWFTSHLYRLIQKADGVNRERLRVAFPQEVREWESWLNRDRTHYPGYQRCGCSIDYHMADCPLRTGPGNEDEHLEAEYEDRFYFDEPEEPDSPSLEDTEFDHADPSNY